MDDYSEPSDPVFFDEYTGEEKEVEKFPDLNPISLTPEQHQQMKRLLSDSDGRPFPSIPKEMAVIDREHYEYLKRTGLIGAGGNLIPAIPKTEEEDVKGEDLFVSASSEELHKRVDPKLVFCKNCKYRRDGGLSETDKCTRYPTRIKNYYESKIYYEYCKSINSENDCKGYEEKSSRFKTILKRVFRKKQNG